MMYTPSRLHQETNIKEIILQPSSTCSSYIDQCEYYKNQRKLTCDSGYGDELTDQSDSFISDNMSTSSENISEHSNIYDENKIHDDLQEIIKTYNDVTLDDNKNEEISVTEINDNSNKVVRQRRVTPIPKSITHTKPSLGHNLSDKGIILFVEEEDDDDVEKFNYEDDYICPDILSCKRYTKKRNSWHGQTADDVLRGYKKRLVTLQKSKSLDRGKDEKTRLRRRMNMSTAALSSERIAHEKKKNYLDSDKSQDFITSIGSNQSTCYSFKTMATHNRDKENKVCGIQVSVEYDTACPTSLPLWMKEAEADMISSDTNSSFSGDEAYLTPDEDVLSKKLDIPTIDWEKLSDTKNKNNLLLSNQRKMFTKQKHKEQRAEQRRRRKLTPSESPSNSSLEKLSNLKNAANEWIVTEEEEEEEEEEENC